MVKTLNRTVLGLCLLAVIMAGGCAYQPMPSPQSGAQAEASPAVLETLKGLEAIGDPADEISRLRDELDKMEKQKGESAGELLFKLAYCYERVKNYPQSAESYERSFKAAPKGPYAMLAEYRRGLVWELGVGNPQIADAELREQARKKAIKQATGAYSRVGRMAGFPIWVREPPLASQGEGRFHQEDIQEVSYRRLDQLYRPHVTYQFMAWAVKLCGNNPKYSAALALLLITVLVKVIITPLTNAQFKSMRQMQKVQPLIKKLQEKHKGDREGMAREQMKLFREHKVNPLGGCLPLLIQMPILILIYRAVQMYIYQFSKSQFLWIPNLAMPDMPLLILYAASMYLSQKLTTMPTADAQQQQMQKMMTVMMPVMFAIIFQTFPSAFILYWLILTILTTAHQWYVLKQPEAAPEQAAAPVQTEPAPVKKKNRPGTKKKRK